MNTTTTTAAQQATPARDDAPALFTLGADLSPAVKAIETAYRMIQRRHPDVPNVTIVVKRDERAWGHTTVAHVWSPSGAAKADRLEIMISGENLTRGAQFVAATLLHETAHARNLAAGVLDTDVNGRHNRKFAESAEHLGLTVAQAGWHGWTATTLTDEQAKAWRQVIATIEAGLRKSAQAHHPAPIAVAGGKAGTAKGGATVTVLPPRKRGNRNLPVATCGCGHKIRAAVSVLLIAAPTCTVCGQAFTV